MAMALPPFPNANPAPDAGAGVVVVAPVEAPKLNVLAGRAAGVGAMALLPAPKANPELGAGAGVEDVAPGPRSLDHSLCNLQNRSVIIQMNRVTLQITLFFKPCNRS